MPDSAHHGRFIAATVSLSKDVAKSLADCAKKLQSILKANLRNLSHDPSYRLILYFAQ